MLGLKLASAACERPGLRHSCGSGQRGPADPAGEVGRERTCSSLPLPTGREKHQAFQEESSAPGTPRSKARLLIRLLSTRHSSQDIVTGRPVRQRAWPSPPWLTHGPKPRAMLAHRLLSSSFANQQHGLSPRVPAQEVPPCTEEPDGCGHRLPDCLGDSRSSLCPSHRASSLQQRRPSAFPRPLLSCLPQFPLSLV